jgi:ribonucleoside-diphosphate reductase alpha chain
MIAKKLIHEDEQLKKLAKKPKHEKTFFEWHNALAEMDPAMSDGAVKVKVGVHEKDFNLGEIANTVGNALTDLFVAREVSDIYNEENLRLVKSISHVVAEEISAQSREAKGRPIAAYDVYRIIEKALVRANQHDLARSINVRRQRMENTLEGDAPPQPIMINTKVIRRNGQVVPWNYNKVEIAVRKAFLSLELNPAPAVEIARAVTARSPRFKTDRLGNGGGTVTTVTKGMEFNLLFMLSPTQTNHGYRPWLKHPPSRGFDGWPQSNRLVF